MGRPALVSDDSIKLDLPRDTRWNPQILYHKKPQLMMFSDLPPAAGLRANVELARISDYIVSNVYDVARNEPLMTTLCIQKSLRMLNSWSENLSPVALGTEENFSSDRAVVELHMGYNQVRDFRVLGIYPH